jgi:hypothetical protein
MSISTMRWMDRWLGGPLCVLLTLLRWLSDLAGWSGGGPTGRIVFVKLAEQGSTVLACSAIRRAIEIVGRDDLWFLVFEENRFILDALGLIRPENVLTIRNDRAGTLLIDALRVIRQMRRLRIDTAIDLEFLARSSAALCF